MAWTPIAGLTYPRRGLALVTTLAPGPGTDLVLYAVGGDDNGPLVSQVEIYDPTSNTWDDTTVPALAHAVTNLAAVAYPFWDQQTTTLHSQVRAIGGRDAGGAAALHGYHQFYDLSNTGAGWQQAQPLNTPRQNLGAAVGPDGLIYAIGGLDSSGTAQKIVEVYDPASDQWSNGPQLNQARAGLAVCVLGGYIYAIGGIGPGVTGLLPSVEVLDPLAQNPTWTALTTGLPGACSALAAAVGPEGIYAIGGFTDPQQTQPQSALSTFPGYDPPAAAPNWTSQPPSPVLPALALLGAALGPDGIVYAVGGQGANASITGAAYQYAAPVNWTAPEPYITNGTYQSPDILLWPPNTLAGNQILSTALSTGGDYALLAGQSYPLAAQIHNASGTDAPFTAVRFWSAPGGVALSAVPLGPVQYVTVPANGQILVPSAVPFQAPVAGTHECLIVSVSNYLAEYINADALNAGEIAAPTDQMPANSGQYASAWHNTNSYSMLPGGDFRFPFTAIPLARGPISVRIEVRTARVPADWERLHEAARLRADMRYLGVAPRVALFLLPSIRRSLEPADALGVHIEAHEDGRGPLPCREHPGVEVGPGRLGRFTVTGVIPMDAEPGSVYLVEVTARYPPAGGRDERTVEFLEVIYVKSAWADVAK